MNSKVNFPQRPEGHYFSDANNRDLEQKLTYQQLLNLNHDLSKENMQLKKIGTLKILFRSSIGSIIEGSA